jgi:hypothetical protein
MRAINHRMRRSLALATAITALAAPAAVAAPAEPESYPSVDPALLHDTSVPTPPPATSASDGGFDWGDAGLGAGAMLGLTAMAAGTAVALRHRPRRSHTLA